MRTSIPSLPSVRGQTGISFITLSLLVYTEFPTEDSLQKNNRP